MTNTKLGLDIGTNSIGWAVLEKEDRKYHFLEKEDEEGKSIPSKGSYIFPKGVDGQERSKAATRRGFRSARRRIDRIRRRKAATLQVLSEYDMCPKLSEEEICDWRYKKTYPCSNDEFIKWQRTGEKGGDIETEKLKQPYYLRYLAATKEGLKNSQVGRYRLGRVFYHLAQRRGYLSMEEEQADDAIEQFKIAVKNLLEESSNAPAFSELFETISDTYKNDKKSKALTTKIKRQLKKETSLDVIKEFIYKEFDKKENLGKVATEINELSQQITESGHPTLGCYFYSIYAQQNADGTTQRIRGKYIDREKHYLSEFNYICDKQKIEPELRKKLQFAIFYQRPLKSQKDLVAKCPLEPKRKRIAISHPLFEEFRKWESINRIKIKTEQDERLRPLHKAEKELIADQFDYIKDIEFKKLADRLCGGKDYRYIKDKEKLTADVEFNFPETTTFPGCPTIKNLKTILGKDENGNYRYDNLPPLNTGYKDEKGKTRISIEDIWHCLFIDSFGEKNKQQARKEFAEKHLPKIDAEAFSKIKLKKGYGNLSKSAIKKILPYLQQGMLYSHAVFTANIDKVLGRKATSKEIEKISVCIKEALSLHEFEKKVNAVVNNYIEKYKNDENGIGDEPNSQWAHRNGIKDEIISWFSEADLDAMGEEEQDRLEKQCWDKFIKQADNKRPQHVEYLSSKTIPDFIKETILKKFPNETIDVSKLYHPSAMEIYPKAENRLGNPEISSIKNPVFNKAMHQIKHLVNKLIEEGLVDKDTEVNIELSREINSATYRRALTQYQKDQKFIRDWARRKIIECYDEEKRSTIQPTDTQITKYILYAEQNRQCLYTSETITPRKFFTEQKYDIEHTIPRSKWNDNSLINKTLANADFNRNYKQDELPANLDLTYKEQQIDVDTILQNRDRWLKSYKITGDEVEFSISLESLKAQYRNNKAAAKAAAGDAEKHNDLMFLAHYARLRLEYLAQKYKTFEREEIPAKFNNANLVDTRLITKYARAYLNSYFNKVNVINGQVTDTLRKIWGLQGEYEEKDRSNHIHHCIDAVTVACIEKGTANRMSEAFHQYERDYFRGNSAAKVYLREPMGNFVDTMKKLKDEVFIYHKQVDRIKPLLDEIENENPQKLNLRGALNSQRPYGLIEKDNQKIFVQRKSVNSISGKDIDNIVDNTIKERLLSLADEIGWGHLLNVEVREEQVYSTELKKIKKELGYKIYTALKKAKANKNLIDNDIRKENIDTEFHDVVSFKNSLCNTLAPKELARDKKEKFYSKIDKEVNSVVRSIGLKRILEQSNGVIILPATKNSSLMVLKKIRLQVNAKLNPLKERRRIDFPENETKAYKRDYYFDKAADSNYEYQIYGDLIPDQPNKKIKFANREVRLINTYNIVKNVFESMPDMQLILKLHKDDFVLVFDENLYEITEDWSIKNLQRRLFKVVKFNENNEIIMERPNYALGNVDAVPLENVVSSEGELDKPNEVVLRRKSSTLRAIPTKVDELGRIDIEYSKAFIEKHTR